MTVERFPVEAGHILLFARSIGDTNPVYDPAHAEATEMGAVIAPPTFVQASAQFDPDYFLRPQPGKVWFGSGSTPSGLSKVPKDEGGGGGGGTGLHAEQHYEYHRPLKAGDALTATSHPGSTWEKEGKRAGRLVFSEMITEYRDASGELVVTARGIGVRTERTVEG